MPKQECTGVLGMAAKEALEARKAMKKGSDKAKAKKGASDAKAPKKAAAVALEVVSADEHVSVSPTPPTPSSPQSPTYRRETWWDSFGDLSQRINGIVNAVKDLQERVKCLEEQCEKDRAAGSVFGKRG